MARSWAIIQKILTCSHFLKLRCLGVGAYLAVLYCWKLKVPEVDKHGEDTLCASRQAPSAKAAKHLKEDVAKETILSFEGPGKRGA